MAASASTRAARATGHDIHAERRRFNTGGILLGIGFGGFVDGIVLHQILQWHHMLTSEGGYPATTVAGLETNTLWDGLFHASTWIFAFVGLLMVTTAMRRGFRGGGLHQLGLLLAGWGTFNLVEGVVDHHILGIHHVKSGDNELLFDLGFLALGAVLLVGGLLLKQRGERETERRIAAAAR